ncbi:MAG: hypothetical protein IJU01_01620 [Lachnospiraceae bacterium]|nr:hypothetical protein [Lachnospiraceae bacterium]
MNKTEVLRLLGYRGQEVPAEINARIDECARQIISAAAPKVIYKQIKITEISETGVCAEGVNFSGRDISHHLDGCGQAVLMAATLGSDVEKLLMRSGVSDMTNALIMDACATEAIEEVCDAFENALRDELRAQGLYLTGRFSPGYGDLPIEMQGELCTFLDTPRKIGLTVSRSSMLNPGKSVTAILGISEKPVRISAAGCDACSKKADCAFRREGEKCNE